MPGEGARGHSPLFGEGGLLPLLGMAQEGAAMLSPDVMPQGGGMQSGIAAFDRRALQRRLRCLGGGYGCPKGCDPRQVQVALHRSDGNQLRHSGIRLWLALPPHPRALARLRIASANRMAAATGR